MRRLALGIFILLVLAGCGDSTSGIGQTAASQLGPQVEQVKAAAMSGDRASAATKLAQLRASVTDLRQGNLLSEAGATKVLAAAAEVEAQLGTPAPQAVTTVAPTSGTAPAVTSAPRPNQPPGNSDTKANVDDKGRGKGKG